MQVGDLVEVNKYCDAGALWGLRGIVVETGLKSKAALIFAGRGPKVVRVMLDGRLHLINEIALDLISNRTNSVHTSQPA